MAVVAVSVFASFAYLPDARAERVSRQEQFEEQRKRRREAMERQQKAQREKLKKQQMQKQAAAQKARPPAKPITRGPSSADSVTTRIPVQSNTGTTKANSTAGALPADRFRQFMESLEPEERGLITRYLSSLTAEQKRATFQELAPTGEEAAKTELLRRARQHLQVHAAAPPAANQPPPMEMAPPGEPADAIGTPIMIAARGEDPTQFRSAGSAKHAKLPAAGSPPPQFALETLDGGKLTLSDFRRRPLVLIFGCITCPVYRAKIAKLDELYQRHKDRADFLFVYTTEAHPQGSPSPYSNKEWLTQKNVNEGVLKPQASSIQQRRQSAEELRSKFGEAIPIAIDAMHNPTWEAYGARPNSAFVIDPGGTVRLAQEWADPAALDTVLNEM